MPPESSRIIELRRRVEAEPGSIAFAQLAEEYRRAGNYEAAVQCCLTGLSRHPAYLSARVTLGRALIELGQLDDAHTELQLVLRTAPDNLAAIRGMAEIYHTRGELQLALDYYRRALPLARHDPEIEEAVSQIKRQLGKQLGPETSSGLSFAQAESELLSALSRMPEKGVPDLTAPPPAAPAPRDSAQALSERPGIDDSTPTELAAGDTAPPAGSERTEFQRVEASAPPLAPVQPPIDFDALLRSLGIPNAPAPPLVETLLAEPGPVVARPEPVLPDLPMEPVAEDPFADLERGLRAFDQARPPSGAPSETVDAEAFVLSPSETVDAEAFALPPGETVDAEAFALPPSETVDAEAFVLSPSETVDAEAFVPSPSETVDAEAFALSPTETDSAEAFALSPSETVDAEAFVLSPSETVDAEAFVLSSSETDSAAAFALPPGETVDAEAFVASPSETGDADAFLLSTSESGDVEAFVPSPSETDAADPFALPPLPPPPVRLASARPAPIIEPPPVDAPAVDQRETVELPVAMEQPVAMEPPVAMERPVPMEWPVPVEQPVPMEQPVERAPLASGPLASRESTPDPRPADGRRPISSVESAILEELEAWLATLHSRNAALWHDAPRSDPDQLP